MQTEEFLEHFGVKGQRWGVRGSRSSSKPSSKKTPPQSSDSKKISSLRQRKPSQLSNKQLRSVNDRMNMEQNFSKLNPTKVQKGHNRVKEILAIATTATALYGISQSPAGKKSIALGKKYLEDANTRTKLMQVAQVAKKSKQLSLM